MADESETRAICACDARSFARFCGEFVYLERWQGWIFTEAPVRRMTPSAQFYAFVDRREYAHENHVGEPLVWLDCPFCGGALPPKDSINPYLFQADGEGPEV
jgi:hypothetical protein